MTPVLSLLRNLIFGDIRADNVVPPSGFTNQLTLFISGATKAITDNALLQEQSQGRYETYLGALDHAMMVANGRQASLDELVDAIERVCLVELDLFCQDALRVSYRF